MNMMVGDKHGEKIDDYGYAKYNLNLFLTFLRKEHVAKEYFFLLTKDNTYLSDKIKNKDKLEYLSKLLTYRAKDLICSAFSWSRSRKIYPTIEWCELHHKWCEFYKKNYIYAK